MTARAQYSRSVASSRSGAGLVGRREVCQVLDDLVAGARAGRSAALVLRGEAGIGKTELLDYLAGRAAGCRIVRAAGIQSEMELSYAGLHQLCSPLLSGLDQLPEPQRNALGAAFGLRAGTAPDPFLVGLAALTLLAHAGADQPLVCLVDDAQWLDQASSLTLGFVGRRLLAESVVLVLAVREPVARESFAGVPDLTVDALLERDSRRLLDSVATAPLDRQVRDRILAEARGNPLALIELPRRWTAAELAGGFAPSWALGAEACAHALLSQGTAAEDLYREAITRLERTRVRVNLARAHLLYGEWLRREDRLADAREQLTVAYDMLSRFGAEAFAERARRELRAAGKKVGEPSVVDRPTLTVQEAQVARLAGDGLTNPEIGARLFLSPHTVDWHLRKVFSKLGIASRREIAARLAQAATAGS